MNAVNAQAQASRLMADSQFRRWQLVVVETRSGHGRGMGGLFGLCHGLTKALTGQVVTGAKVLEERNLLRQDADEDPTGRLGEQLHAKGIVAARNVRQIQFGPDTRRAQQQGFAKSYNQSSRRAVMRRRQQTVAGGLLENPA